MRVRALSRYMLNCLALANYGALTRSTTTVASGKKSGREKSIAGLGMQAKRTCRSSHTPTRSRRLSAGRSYGK